MTKPTGTRRKLLPRQTSSTSSSPTTCESHDAGLTRTTHVPCRAVDPGLEELLTPEEKAQLDYLVEQMQRRASEAR